MSRTVAAVAALALLSASILLTVPPAGAQSPAPAPAAPAPANPAAPAPVQAPAPAAPSAAGPSPLKAGDPFGETVTLPEKTIISISGQANWDTAFETLAGKFKDLNTWLDQHHVAPNGPAMTVYTQTDDLGFNYQVALPVAEAPKDTPTGDIAVGKSPGGKALRYVHRGSYDTLDSTYEAITNDLDKKGLDAKDMFIEEYDTDLSKTNEDKLVVNIYVPIKTP
ncbi:MAG: GyrI-like domain-containing protein [Pseudolabrys sp.]